jgi:hypothetical protein
MPRFSIQAESASAGYTIKRHTTPDGSDAVFKNQADAQESADIWINTINEAKYAEVDDWVAIVAKS